MVRTNALSRAAMVGLLVLLLGGVVHAFELISENEAKLPDDDIRTRAIFLGPRVVVVDPAPTAGMIKSPFILRVRFEPRGGARVDLDSVVVTYQKRPLIDLTQRIKRYIQPTGIVVEDAAVPAGEHRIRIDVRDTDGRRGSAEFTVRVAR
jgi:hypothetical protein